MENSLQNFMRRLLKSSGPEWYVQHLWPVSISCSPSRLFYHHQFYNGFTQRPSIVRILRRSFKASSHWKVCFTCVLFSFLREIGNNNGFHISRNQYCLRWFHTESGSLCLRWRPASPSVCSLSPLSPEQLISHLHCQDVEKGRLNF